MSASTPSATSAAISCGVIAAAEIEIEPQLGAACRETRAIRGLLRRDHAVEPGADEGERERRRNDAERRRRDERRKPHAGQRRDQIDDKERKAGTSRRNSR